MKNLRYAVVAAVLVASLLWGAFGRSPAVAQFQPPPRWEYCSVTGNPNVVQEYNKLGADGWELCGLVPGYTVHDTIAVFKRLKR